MSIRDEEAEAKARWLFDNAAAFGRLRGLRVVAEERLKSLRASLASRAPDTCKSVDARNNWALDHPEYKRALDELGEAVTNDETERARRVGAEAILEAWRTMSANQRGRL